MRDAAVGHQCPTCVSEGAKATRSGRTAYGGLRSGNPGLTSLVLIGINVFVWLLLAATGGQRSEWYARLALLPGGRCLDSRQPDLYYPGRTEASCTGVGDWVPGVADGAVWQLLTSAFTHVDLWHIGFNMLALWFLGPQLEQVVGRARFLALYLLSGLAGSTLVYWLAERDGSTIGASGAVFGLMAALVVVAFKVRGNLQPILMWIGINFLITVVGRDFISWQGHLGGFLGGLAIAATLVYAPRSRRSTWQVAGITAIALLLVVAVVTRTPALA
jgi:membrane associated rhomboid family serine protease